MKGDKSNPITKTDFELIMDKLIKIEKRLDQLENNRRPTIPIYDAANMPAEGAEGQIVIA
jgi:hypothetical protein